ncbi:MAG: apolipoprotein N-acyltransferase [Verrucomicrobia bacterium]|nr:apolipoprotein N-acyltransferase [Verrucomicrobiota bacterium]MBS0647141.1 apolipoprotein N-acyltransferase [Verrucomicrobiota bacterium]
MKRILPLISSFILVALAQPDFSLVACVLAGICGYALFWFSLIGASKKKIFFTSLVWMMGVQMIHTNWMTSVEYVGAAILFGWFLHNLSMGGIFALVSLGVGQATSLIKQLALCGIWVILEWARPWLFFGIGFAWNPLGLPLTAHVTSLQMASIAGIMGLSFWVLWTNLLFFHKQKLVIAVAILPYLLGGGLYLWHHQTDKEDKKVEALLVQLATYPRQSEREIWERFFQVLAPHIHETYDLIVLAEGALPRAAQNLYIPSYFVENMLASYWGIHKNFYSTPYLDALTIGKLLAQNSQGSVVIGMNDEQQQKSYNAAFHFHPSNEIEVYHKRKLLAFGEYLPICFAWARSLLPLPPDFTAGQSSLVFGQQLPFAVAICYEETLGELNRAARNQGAQLLLGLTNDMWYPRSRLPVSHLHHARVRTVELGMPLLRACNTGVTCAINSTGQVLQQLPYESRTQTAQEGVLKVVIPLHCYQTLYLIWGDKFILGLSLGFIALSCCRKRKCSLHSRAFV